MSKIFTARECREARADKYLPKWTKYCLNESSYGKNNCIITESLEYDPYSEDHHEWLELVVDAANMLMDHGYEVSHSYEIIKEPHDMKRVVFTLKVSW